MYQAIADLPILNRSAVAKAPSHTSRQASCRSGSHLKSIEKSSVSTPSETAKLRRPSRRPSDRDLPNQDDNAARPALMTSETARRKPSARMPAKDIP